MARTATTRAEVAFSRLRADILDGALPPGEKLPFAVLCERYGFSIGVIREALSRLAELGLVVAEPQLGYRVIPLSVDDLEDLTTTRCEIEGAALALSVQHGDLAWESSVVAAHHALERTPAVRPDGAAGINPEWVALHRCFHAALLDGCPAPRLVSIAASLRDAAEVYRSWSFDAARPSARDVAVEHRAMLVAALDRDAAAAAQLLQEHLRSTAEELIARFANAMLNS
ncbi:MAG: GntR family transcriptional regulator [Vicinamibacterales bacterium]